MKHFKPFDIVHLNTLDIPLDTALLPLKENKYVVLWWKNIPLCHVFLYANEYSSKEKLLERLFNELWTAIDYYAVQQNTWPDESVKESWFKQDAEKWNEFLEHICGMYLPNKPLDHEVSIVICTRNRSAFLQTCLQKLDEQVYAPKEIIVVDNAPLDDSTKKVVESFSNVTYCLEERPGLDFARNAGARAATGDIVAFTDDDAMLHPLWTYYISNAFHRDDIMGVTGLIFASEIESEAQMIFESFWSFNRGYVFKEFNNDYFKEHLAKGVPAWEIGAGASMAFRKKIFDLIGYFDERLDVGAAGCSGDSEYWYRVLAEGYTIIYTPLAVAHHQHRREIKALKRQIFFYMRGFTAALYVQHERYRHKGNLRHLYRKVLPYYLTILPKAMRYRFQYNYSTYMQELKGIFSGLLFYYRNKRKLLQAKPVKR